MPECPYCGRWFRTKRGLNQHISKSHTTQILGEKVIDVSTIDPIGAEIRREERRRKRKKRGLFDLF